MHSCSAPVEQPPGADPSTIEKYLDEKVMQPSFGGKIFSAHQVLMTDKDKIYIWAYVQEYYKQSGKTELGSGWSVPMVLNIEWKAGLWSITGHETPGDGSQYGDDIRRLFPQELHQKIFDFSGTDDMRSLEKRSVERAEEGL
jgi:hypothetical protein